MSTDLQKHSAISDYRGDDFAREPLSEEQRQYLYSLRYNGKSLQQISEEFMARYKGVRRNTWSRQSAHAFFETKRATKEYASYVDEKVKHLSTEDLGSPAQQVAYLASIARDNQVAYVDKIRALALIVKITQAVQARHEKTQEKVLELNDVITIEGFGNDDPLMANERFTTAQNMLIKMIDESSEETLRNLTVLSKEEIARAIEIKEEIRELRDQGVVFEHEHAAVVDSGEAA